MGFDEAVAKARQFRDERDWAQFHNPKDLAISINLEASELLEIFQWSGADLEVSDKTEEAKNELADIVMYSIYLADRLRVDLGQVVSDKIAINESRYPVSASKGNSRKYSER